MASESMTAETLKKYIFGENFFEKEDLISEKLKLHNEKIRKVFARLCNGQSRHGVQAWLETLRRP